MHGPEEQAEIVVLFVAWGDVDRSHRKLAHRGSYLNRVWVSPSSVKRVLTAQGLHSAPSQAGRRLGQATAPGASYTKGMIWTYDADRHEAPGTGR